MRKQLIEILFDITQKIYTKSFKKKEPWGVSVNELLTYPNHTFGYKLGRFLDLNGFELIPKVERHDAYHTLTGFGTKVEDEIALQYLCFGNGKRSPYLLGVLFIGTVILPDYLNYYLSSYKIGKQANEFHHFDYKKLLNINFELFKDSIFTQQQVEQLTLLQNGKITKQYDTII